MRKFLATCVVLLYHAALAYAAPVTGVRIDVYTPTSINVSVGNVVVPIADVVCDLTPAPMNNMLVTNPTTVEYVDEAHAGKACRVNIAAFITDLAPGSYTAKAKLMYGDVEGTASASSVSFSRVESIPQGIRVIKP